MLDICGFRPIVFGVVRDIVLLFGVVRDIVLVKGFQLAHDSMIINK